MKRFKLIFQIIYVITTLVILYFSIDILFNTEQYLSKIKLSSYVKFPKYIMTVFLLVSLMMLINFILEKFHIYKIKDGISSLQEEVVQLKAKLYDKEDGEQEDEDSDEEEIKKLNE